MKRLNTLALVAATILTSAAFADERDVSSLQFGTEGWTWVPTTLDAAVESFVGLRADTTTGENITAVWFRRLSDGSWESWAWSEQDQSKAIASVKSVLGLADSTDSKWPVVPSTDPADPPEKLTKGVLDSDPFAPIVEGIDDPAALVSALEYAGWQAAWIDVWDYECEDIVVLDVWVEAVELEDDVVRVERRIDGLLIERDCTTAIVREQIWCWVDAFWTSFDAGSPISFDGTGIGIQQDWHPFDEVVQAYEDLYPGIAISDAVYGGAWGALTPAEQQNFRDLSLTLEYESFSDGKVRAPGDPGSLPDEPTPPTGDPDCDHEAFYARIKQLMGDMPWTDLNLSEECLYQDEGWLDSLSNCPQFDCDDFADTIGSCLLRQLSDDGHEVVGRNKKIIMNCPWRRGVGHTIFAIYYCGYWYIIDGGAWDHPIGIVPGTIDDPFPIDEGVAEWLRALYEEMPCKGFSVTPKGEWESGERPWIEPDPWYTSPSEVARVAACLRGAGLSDEEIAEVFGCAIPAGQLQQVLEWIDDAPGPPAPTCGACHPLHH